MKMTKNKFYKVEEQLNNLHWKHIAYFKTLATSEKYTELHKKKTSAYPVRIVECEFSSVKDIK